MLTRKGQGLPLNTIIIAIIVIVVLVVIILIFVNQAGGFQTAATSCPGGYECKDEATCIGEGGRPGAVCNDNPTQHCCVKI